MNNQEITGHIERLVKEYKLAEESLTEKQLVEVIRQAIAAGDFIRFVNQEKNGQSIVYLPFAEKQRLEDMVKELEDALKANKVFHTPIALRRRGGKWDEYEMDAINRTKNAVGP